VFSGIYKVLPLGAVTDLLEPPGWGDWKALENGRLRNAFRYVEPPHQLRVLKLEMALRLLSYASDCGRYRRFLMRISQLHRAHGEGQGFTLGEVMVGSALIGIMSPAFIAGFSKSFQGVQLDRENSRATAFSI